MSTDQQPPLDPNERVGFRDIYRAVGESESRIKEHLSLIMLPLNTQVTGLTAAVAAQDVRLQAVEAWQQNDMTRGGERRRLGDLSVRALGVIVVATNFVLGLILMFVNLLTDHHAA